MSLPPYKGAELISNNSYCHQAYPKPITSQYGDYIIYDSNTDYNTSSSILPVYYKPITISNNNTNKTILNKSDIYQHDQTSFIYTNNTANNTTLIKSENPSLKNVYSHLNHPFNVNSSASTTAAANEKNSIYFSTRY